MTNTHRPIGISKMITTGLLAGVVALFLSWALSAGGQSAKASEASARLFVDMDDHAQAAGMAVPAHPSGERNAALDLWRLWEVIGHLAIRQIHDGFDSDTSWTPKDRVLQTLVEIEESTQQLVRVSRVPLCDFQPRYEEGVWTLLPHLAKMRSTAIILAADARRLAEAGKHDQAAERIEAIVRIAGHSASDRVLIGSLVGAAILKLAQGELERLDNQGSLTAEGKARILIALDQAPGLEADDTLRFKQSIMMERDVMIGGLKEMLRGEEAGDMLAVLGATTVQSVMMRAMTDAAIDAEIRKGRRFYDEVLEAWDADDAEERLEALDTRVAQRRDGLFVAIMAPAITKTHGSQRSAAETMTAMRAIVAAESPR